MCSVLPHCIGGPSPPSRVSDDSGENTTTSPLPSVTRYWLATHQPDMELD